MSKCDPSHHSTLFALPAEGTLFPRGGKVIKKRAYNSLAPSSSTPKRKKFSHPTSFHKSKPRSFKNRYSVPEVIEHQSLEKKFDLKNVFLESKMTLGLIKHIDDLELLVALANGQTGSVSIAEISPRFTERVQAYTSQDDNEGISEQSMEVDHSEEGEALAKKSLPNLKQVFHRGQLVCVKIVEMPDKKKRSRRFELTMLPQQLNAAATHVKKGQLIQATIKSKEDHGWILDFGIEEVGGFLPFEKQLDPKEYVLGQPLLVKLDQRQGRFFHVHPLPANLQFDSPGFGDFTFATPVSYLPFKWTGPEATDLPKLTIKVGEVLYGTVESFVEHGMMVKIPSGHFGLVPLHHISDTMLSEPEKKFPLHSTHKYRVLSIENDQRFALTAKKTFLETNLPLILGYQLEFVNTIGHGVIFKVLGHGCVVQFFNNTCAFVPLSQMSYEPLTSTEAFHRGQMVKCKIMSVNPNEKKMMASFLVTKQKKTAKSLAIPATPSENQAEVNMDHELSKEKKESEHLQKPFNYSALPNTIPIEKPSDLSVNLLIHGYVRNIRANNGVYVAFSPKVYGRIPFSNLDADEFKDWKSRVNIGDLVACRVLSVQNNKVELICNDASTSQERQSDTKDSERPEQLQQHGKSKEDSKDFATVHVTKEINGYPPMFQADLNELEVMDDGPVLKTNGFKWSNSMAISSEESNAMNVSSSDNEAENDELVDANEMDDEPNGVTLISKKKAQRLRRIEKEKEERLVSRREQSLLGPPQLSADFERLILGSPNSSFLWIQYMAFFLKQGQLEKARQTAQRALDTIHYREEKEKLHIWVAWMNLEQQFGTAKTLEALVKRALEYNDPKIIYFQLIHIYLSANQVESAKTTFELLTNKFKQSCKVWTRYVQFLLEQKWIEQARDMMQRCLTSLPKAKHIKTITQCAMLEFKYGDPKRGRALFEGIMANHPVRVDLWNVYLDMEIKLRDLLSVRHLFDRLISLKFSPRKMKFFFKKYLEFEKSIGDPSRVEYVKKKAVEYVEAINSV